MAAAKPILVPLDGSKLAEYALPAAAWYARATSAQLTFIHVVDGDLPVEARSRAAETFQRYAGELAASRGIANADTMVLAGNAADQILSAATGASAIALASHGRGGFRAMVRGSVADKVVRGSAVPVLVEPGTEEPGERGPKLPILVGLDGSEEAERGLVVARELAAGEGRPIALLRTFSVPPPVGVEFAAYPADLATTLERSGREYLSGIARPGEETILGQGDAATALLEASEKIDAFLIVLTKSGRGLASRLALGSTTDRVIHGTERPVLVIPAAP